jgi:hypothetical protein
MPVSTAARRRSLVVAKEWQLEEKQSPAHGDVVLHFREGVVGKRVYWMQGISLCSSQTPS